MATNNCGNKLFLSLILRSLELPDTSHYCHSGADNYLHQVCQSHHKVSPPFLVLQFEGVRPQSVSVRWPRYTKCRVFPVFPRYQVTLQRHNQRLNFHQPGHLPSSGQPQPGILYSTIPASSALIRT